MYFVHILLVINEACQSNKTKQNKKKKKKKTERQNIKHNLRYTRIQGAFCPFLRQLNHLDVIDLSNEGMFKIDKEYYLIFWDEKEKSDCVYEMLPK